MKAINGHLILSLDFELFWGVFDARSLDSYKENLHNVKTVIPRLLELCDTYDAKLSFATVGMLFAKSKEELLSASPALKPTYNNSNFNVYQYISSLGSITPEDPYHYANSLLELIRENGNHEIGSHTYSHYYCNEAGQDKFQFEDDLKANIAIAKKNNIALKSFVFPRNQINKDYLTICKNHGIICYRGIEKHWIYNTHDTKTLESPICKIIRLLDSYVNITGNHTYDVSAINTDNSIINLPASKFLRPYSSILRVLEGLKLKRIKNAMTSAAKENKVYHLWWHPHNFGSHIDKNFEGLEQILKQYSALNKSHGFKSVTMQTLASEIMVNS
jgi:peptidoglycan/xylan/chitin deacetylase (PgdA/CDA1 family)